jgi:hypothetical protein
MVDFCELKRQIEKSGLFSKSRPEVINEMPFDRDIVFVPIRTRKQAELCFECGIEVYERILPHNGMKILCAPMNFETIIKAVSKYNNKV